MFRLRRRPPDARLADNESAILLCAWLIPIALGLVGGSFTMGPLCDSNRDRQFVRDVVRVLSVRNHGVKDQKALGAARLVETIVRRSPAFSEHAVARQREQNSAAGKPLVPIDPELSSIAALGNLGEILGQVERAPEAIARAVRGQAVAPAILPAGFWAPWRTFGLIALIGWAIGSVLELFLSDWWFGIFRGYHPSLWTDLRDGRWGEVCTGMLLTLPAVPLEGSVLGIFYVCYGVARWWTRSPAAAAEPFAAGLTDREPAEAPAPPPAQPARAPAAAPVVPPPSRRTWTAKDVERKVAELKSERARVLERFRGFGSQLFAHRLATVQQEATAAASELERVRRRVVATQASLRRLQTAPPDGGSFTDEKFAELEQHPWVRAVGVKDDGWVSLFLQTLVIEAKRRRYEIGDFVLLLNPFTRLVQTECLRTTNPQEAHPFGSEGKICFGGDGEAVLKQFLERGTYHSFVDYAVQMMRNPKDEMSSWKEV